jgi:uncharacterized protein (UPF0305 family)
MELSPVERQIKTLKKRLCNELIVMLRRDIELNARHPEPKSRETIVSDANDYVINQFFNRCASRGIYVITYKDSEKEKIIEEYLDEEKTPFNWAGNSIEQQRGKL